MVLLARLCTVWLFLALSGCTTLFFFPSQREYLRAEDLGLKKEDVRFTGRHGDELTGWWLPASESSKGTILFLHGNAENVSSHVMSVHWLPAAGWNVFLLDYRGYGQSGGTPSVRGCIEDAEDALAWLLARREVDPQRIVLFGQSLGGAIAVNVAFEKRNRRHLQALIVDSAFSSFPEIVRDKLGDIWLTWPLQYPLSVFTSGRYNPLKAISKLDGLPLLLIHGAADRIVLPYHSERLFEAAKEPKTFWKVPGAVHIEALRRKEYREKLLAFLDGARHHRR